MARISFFKRLLFLGLEAVFLRKAAMSLAARAGMRTLHGFIVYASLPMLFLIRVVRRAGLLKKGDGK